MKYLILFGMTLLIMGSCTKKDLILDIQKVVDKTPHQVVGLLGEPDTAYTQVIVRKPIFTQIYERDYKIEIMYPEGLSTDVVIYDPAPGLPYSSKTLSRFGLDNSISPSDSMANAYLKWKNYPGFKTINFFATKLDSAGGIKQYRIFFKSDGELR